MPIGISTLCTFGQTFKVLDHYVRPSIPLIEILDDWRDRLNPLKIARLKELKHSYDVAYTIHSPILDMNIASASERFRKISVRQVMESLEHASDIGARIVVVHPGSGSPLDDYYPGTHWSHNVESIRKIIASAEDLGVDVGIENMPNHTNSFMQSPQDFLALSEEGIDVKVTLDVGHANTTSQLGNFLDLLSSRIIHVHLHDNLGKRDDHLVIGKGTIDWGWLSSRLSLGFITGIIESTSMADARSSFDIASHLFSS